MFEHAPPVTEFDDSDVEEGSPEHDLHTRLASDFTLPKAWIVDETSEGNPFELEPYEIETSDENVLMYLEAMEVEGHNFLVQVLRSKKDVAELKKAVGEIRPQEDAWPIDSWIADGRPQPGSTIITVRSSAESKPQGFAHISRELNVQKEGDRGSSYHYRIELVSVYVRSEHRGQGLSATLAHIVGECVKHDIGHLTALARMPSIRKRYGWLHPYFEVYADLESNGGEMFALRVLSIANRSASSSFTKAEWKKLGREPDDLVSAEIGF